ncbi:hypothetical protein [Methanoculleus chikugoensis]|uniref:hypothetical protein n=1 Tax=Methanoculleus chikugoensis TaxID=118126 RepID=UPI0006D08AAA|nr:hypothetical protein [Methanoculleus chikugoensis]
MEFIETNFSNRAFEEIVGGRYDAAITYPEPRGHRRGLEEHLIRVRERHPGVPWSGMARMRDQLIHG